jgi:hypothetical protein
VKRAKGMRGGSTVEFAILAPALFAVVGLTMFSAYAYQVRSELQRAASRVADYGTTKCDYRGSYPAGSGCVNGGTHRSEAELVAFAKTQFQNVDFVADDANCTLGSRQAVLCRTVDAGVPGAGDPQVNQRMRIVLLYKWDTPFSGFLRAVGPASSIVNLEAHGEATVE